MCVKIRNSRVGPLYYNSFCKNYNNLKIDFYHKKLFINNTPIVDMSKRVVDIITENRDEAAASYEALMAMHDVAVARAHKAHSEVVALKEKISALESEHESLSDRAERLFPHDYIFGREAEIMARNGISRATRQYVEASSHVFDVQRKIMALRRELVIAERTFGIAEIRKNQAVKGVANAAAVYETASSVFCEKYGGVAWRHVVV